VPENLRPKLVSGAENQPTPPAPTVEKRDAEAPTEDSQEAGTGQNARAENSDQRPSRTVSQPPPNANLGGASAVTVQVQESTPAASLNTEQKLEPGLSDEERAAVAQLKERDREVRAHENAHASAGGAYAGSPSYEFTRGPDGVQYAVGGQVDIDTSEVPGDPRATIAKLEVVRSAALAPARPSGQDRAVAAAAAAKSQEAAAELAQLEKEELETKRTEGEGSADTVQSTTTDEGERASSALSAFEAKSGGEAFSVASDQPTISINLLV